MKRYLQEKIREALSKRMVFVGGPRQVGKTTLALQILGPKASERHPAYLNWDHPQDRKNLVEGILPAGEGLIILDEIHKYRSWRNLVKGLYDKNKGHIQFLITGSARLDYYRRGGDSLLGRYTYYRLHPFSLGEIGTKKVEFDRLWTFGGFPEMYTVADEVLHRQWQRFRVERIIKDDLLSLEQVREVSQIELLTLLLKERVGTRLSPNGLRKKLSCSHESLIRWVGILENIYYCYRIYPYHPANRIRALKKESKVYLWDWSELTEEGAKFENLLASHLLKYCHYHEDIYGHKMELRFIRDKEGREIDFVVLKKGEALFAVECKLGERGPSKNIAYYASRTDIPTFYQVHRGGPWNRHAQTRCEMLSFADFAGSILQV